MINLHFSNYAPQSVSDKGKTHEGVLNTTRADFVGRRTPNKRKNALASPTCFLQDAFFSNSCSARTSFILSISRNLIWCKFARPLKRVLKLNYNNLYIYESITVLYAT